MFRKLLAVLCLVCLVPLAAYAWSLNTWAKTGGGSIVVNGGTPQTSVNGTVYKNYTTSQPLTVTVSANAGYTVSLVNYNGVVSNNPDQTSYTVQGPNAQKVHATFLALPGTTPPATGGTATAPWSLNTWVKTGGGTIVVSGGTPQTAVNGTVFRSYTTSKPLTVAVNADSGYIISQVNYNNVIMDNPGQTTYSVQGPNTQKVHASFSGIPLTVTASAGVGGTVNLPSLSGITYGSTLTTARLFTFTPNEATANVVDITGIPAEATVSSVLPAAAGTSVTVTLPVGFAFTDNIAISGSFFSPPVAKTSASQTVLLGKTVTLDGRSSTGSSSTYEWTQTSGPDFPATKVIADSTPGAQVTFTPTATGVYTFVLTVAGGSTASTTVTVTDTPPVVVYENIIEVARASCNNCHSSIGVRAERNVFGNWSSSGHKTKGVICFQCHVGANTGGHPGLITKSTVNVATFDFMGSSAGNGNFCVSCHNPEIVTDFALSKHSIQAGSASCSFCHVQGAHNPSTACIECHKADNTYGLEWPPAAFTFHNSFTGSANICKVCHTTHNPKVLSIKTSCP